AEAARAAESRKGQDAPRRPGGRPPGSLHRCVASRPRGRGRTSMTSWRFDRAGLYVHIPFCLTRCGYCDFNTYAGLAGLAGRYVDALKCEAELTAPEWRSAPFGSIFFGGGTPTTLPAPTLRD